MIIVVDTNVFVGACIGSGASVEVVRACIEGRHKPLMGSALFAEYEDVLGRTSVFRRSRLSAGKRSEIFDVFLASCRWTRVYFGWRPNLRDEADNHLVELAVAGAARHIVTHNFSDFSRMELRFPELRMPAPRIFLKEEAGQ